MTFSASPIYNTHRATLAHFDAIHIGLTATPNPGELLSLSEHEKTLIKNTYIYFDCWDHVRKQGKPTFSYTIQEGINEGHLADYKIYSAKSKLTFEGAKWKGEEIMPGRWGRDTESEDRLKLIIQEYFKVEEERPQERPRKTIVFAVGEKQAVILTRLFNQLLPDEACLRIAKQLNCSASQVRQGFAQTITSYSNNGNFKKLIQEFKYDPLPIMAVSVDILDTGYDHKEVENLVMIRPTKSVIKYAQMRGRGSRRCPRIGKTEFLIYDFAGNKERFDDKGQDYHRPKEIISRPRKSGSDQGKDFVPEPSPETKGSRGFILIPEGSLEDEIQEREWIVVGPEGLEIDQQQYRDKWNETVIELNRVNPAVQKIFVGEDLNDREWDVLKLRLDSPSFYFSEQSLQRAFDQPTGSLSDFIRSALGLYQFPTREERIEQIFRVWVTEHSLNPEQSKMLNLLKQRVLKREKVEMRMFSQTPFSLLGGRVRMEQIFGKEELPRIVEELNTLLVA